MAKLNQIIAIEKGVKSQVYAEISEIHKGNEKPELFNGAIRVYQPLNDEGVKLPDERQRVQLVVAERLRRTEQRLSELMDITARKDWTNCQATASVEVEGHVIARDVPVTYLLFLEKQLTDIRKFVSELPVLDDAEDWTYDPNAGYYRSAVRMQHRNERIVEPIVLYPATPEHPAQTQMINKDVLAGHWHNTKLSGAMPKPEKEAMAARVDKLLQAVKMARETANGIDEALTPPIGTALFNYVLRGE